MTTPFACPAADPAGAEPAAEEPAAATAAGLAGAAPLSVSRSDHLRLAEHVSVEPDHVGDSLTGRHLRINGSARIALELIASGGTFGDITDAYASTFDIDPGTASRDVRSIATSLDAMSMLVLTPHLPSRLRLSALWGSLDRLIRLEWDTPSARRYPGTLPGLLRAVTRSGRWSLLGATVSALLLLAVLLGFSTRADTPGGAALTYGEIGNSTLYALTPLLINVLLLAQLAAHEVGHVLAARRYRTVNYVAVRGLRLYVAHGELRRGPVRLIALAGPVGGVTGAAATAACGLLIGLGPLVSILLAAMSIPHLWSLTPWSSDGRYIWDRHADSPAPDAADPDAAAPCTLTPGVASPADPRSIPAPRAADPVSLVDTAAGKRHAEAIPDRGRR